MRVFITGGTGFIGSAVVQELVASGHQVAALHRSPASGERLARQGAEPVPGDLHEPAGWEEAAARHEALIHCAFDYATDGVRADASAIRTLRRAAARGGASSFIYTSGCWVLGETGEEPADEGASTERPAAVVSWRPAHERLALEGPGSEDEATETGGEEAGGDLLAAVVRPAMVYGGHGGLTRKLFESAEQEGASTYVGEGDNHWSLVHRRDLARLYRMVAETGARGIFHGVDGHPVAVVAAATAASEAAGAGGAVRSIPVERARESLGKVADALCLDQRLVARRSAELGWRPDQRSFLDAAEQAYRELMMWRH